MSATLLIGLLAAAAASQQPQSDTTFAIRAGARVDIETFGGEIRVTAWDKNMIRVQATHGRRDHINIDSRGASVTIEAEGHMGPANAVTLNIHVPASVSLSMSGVYTDIIVDGVSGDVDAETVQGSITVNGGARLKLASVEGDIVVDKARGRISANTVNRGIRITNSVGDIEAETVNGPIIVRNAQATNVDLATVNGRVVYDGAIRTGGDYAITSHNGPIYVAIPEKAGVAISVSTFNGELDSSFPLSTHDVSSRNRYNFIIGNGGARLDLESFGGDIHLKRPGESLPGDLEPPRPPKIKMKMKNHNQE